MSELAAPRATPAGLKPLAGPWNALQVPIKTGGEDFGVREPHAARTTECASAARHESRRRKGANHSQGDTLGPLAGFVRGTALGAGNSMSPGSRDGPQARPSGPGHHRGTCHASCAAALPRPDSSPRERPVPLILTSGPGPRHVARPVSADVTAISLVLLAGSLRPL